MVMFLRERRRRRLEVSGEPFAVRPYEGLTDQNRSSIDCGHLAEWASTRRRADRPPDRIASNIDYISFRMGSSALNGDHSTLKSTLTLSIDLQPLPPRIPHPIGSDSFDRLKKVIFNPAQKHSVGLIVGE